MSARNARLMFTRRKAHESSYGSTSPILGDVRHLAQDTCCCKISDTRDASNEIALRSQGFVTVDQILYFEAYELSFSLQIGNVRT
jgi:hypothetical protein